jgi:hypothetical protein
MKKRKNNIFIGMVEIAGYYGNLASALRMKGYFVTQLGGAHIFNYYNKSVKQPFLVQIYDFYQSKKNRTPPKFFLKKSYYVLSTLVISLFFFIYALVKYDVFIFGFGSSFFPKNIDLVILKFFGKTIISNLGHGSEARPIYINGFQSSHDVNHMIAHSKKMSKKIQFIEKNSSMVIAAPLSSHYVRGPYINFLVLGIPYYRKNHNNISARKLDASIRVLHAPSHPTGKGTAIIRDAINSLKNKGYLINYVEVVGQSNSKVLEEIEKCDFVVDQVYSDTPLAGFATEAAFFGKPAVVGGYGLEQLKKILPLKFFPISEICDPDHIELAIERLIVDKVYREDLGFKAYNFVTANWHAEKVAERYAQLIERNIPEEWWGRPEDINYVYGVGFSAKKIRHYVKEIISVGGVAALQLDDKPCLLKEFSELDA